MNAVTSGRGRVVILGPDEHFRAAQVPAGVAIVLADRRIFPDGEQIIDVPECVDLSGRDVLVVQSTSAPQDSRLLTLVHMLDVATYLGAAVVTCFVPYLCYQRQDRRMRPGEPNSARIVLALARSGGAAGLITVDRHSDRPEVAGLYVRNISAAVPFATDPPGWVDDVDLIVAADAGGAGRAAGVADLLGRPLLVLDKKKDDSGTYYDVVGPAVKGKHCLVIEDVCSSGSTLVPLRDALWSSGARMSVFVTHLLAGRATITAKLGADVHVATSDSSGDREAEVRLLPLAVDAWLDGRY